jgi:surface protein
MVFFHPVFKHDVDQPVHVKNKLSPNAKKRRVKKQPFTFTYSPSGPITLELSSAKVTINWGDASSEKVKGNKSVTHAYVIPDNVTVSIKGTAKSIKFTTPGYVAVTSWGTLGFTSFANMFNTVTVTGLPPTIPATVRDMSGMFAKSSFLNGDISKWNVSKVTNMSAMFAESPFNQDISEWDVGNVTNMTAMFFKSSFTGSIYKWNVSNVTKMTGMFAKSPFNGDISIWNVSKVTDMSAMFNDATLFNKDISKWTVNRVTNMCSLFNGAKNFNQGISNWKVDNVTDMSNMFAESTFTQDISSWTVSKVTNMSGMFVNSLFNGNISNWKVNNVTDMSAIINSPAET